MDLGLLGKRALVTGSTAGIGEAIARTLAVEGAKVVIHGRREAEARRVCESIASCGGEAAVALGDLSVESTADNVAAAAESAFGGIDILINNAGGCPAKPWFGQSGEDWNGVYNANVASMVRMINRLVPGMKQRGHGRVIVIAGGLATKPEPQMGAYSAAKAAIVNLAVSLAQELTETGVTCNAVSPGLVMTPGLHKRFDAMGVTADSALRAKLASGMSPNPIGRPGYPQDVAAAVVFLASAQADFINGQNLRVDGGCAATVN